MSTKSLDLSKKADFLLATGSAISEVAGLFGRDPSEWDIEEASYNNVPFLVFKTKVSWGGAVPTIRDSGGRRLSQLQFPYRDGQTTDDLGRKPEAFDVEAIIFGNSYVAGMKILLRELQKPAPGLLVHPVRGVVTCKMVDYELRHEHQSRKAVILSLRFVEHNFTLASYGRIADVKNFKSILSTLIAGFQVLNNLYNKVRAAVNLYNSVINTINTLVASYESAFSDTLVSLNQVFNKGTSIDLPALLPVNQGGVLLPDGTLSQGVITSASVPNDPFRSVPVAQLQAAIEASQQVFATAGTTGSSSFSTSDEGSQIAGVSTLGISTETAANLSASLQSIIARNKVNSTRAIAQELIQTLEAVQFNQPSLKPLGEQSDGSLEFAPEILDIKRMNNLLQDAFETGAAAAQIGARIFTTPRLMTLREIAFAANISIDRVPEIDLLNPELDSTNYIAARTEIVVPL